jgi:membrane-anchored mycosin MYCP
MTWEGEDEEEMVVEEVSGAAPLLAFADEEPLAPVVPAAPVEVAPPPPPPLPTTTVSPSVAVPSAPAPPAPAPQAMRIDVPPPVEAAVVRAVGTLEPERPRTIGALLRAALRLFEAS